MNVLASRSRGSAGQVAVTAAGQAEPVDPVYYKPVSPSPVSARTRVPSEPAEWKAPVVMRGQRRNGMRYLYASGAVAQPLSPLGTGPDVGIGVWSSEFQPDLHGPVHDAGFNDALFQAGYPGFNLALSFKVATLPRQVTGPGAGIHMTSSNVVTKIVRTPRAGGSG